MKTGAIDAARPAAVVIGLDCITGLQTARILAGHGVPVIGLASNLRHYCCRTRVAATRLQVDIAGESLVEALERLASTLGRQAVLYPCTDGAVLQLARHRARLETAFHVALPDLDVVEALMDKGRFSAFAEAAGLPVPRSCRLGSREDAERAAAQLPFPCVVKPRVKSPRWVRHTSAKAFRVASPRELLELYDRCAGWTDELVAQQWVEGPDSALYSCNCYYDRAGRALVTFVARKLRQWPPRTGTSCLGEECRNDVVLDLTRRAFGATAFHGLGYLEVKRDARTGDHYVIEANVGRPTGRSAIAEAGGVELLYAMYCDQLGLPLPGSLEQRYDGAKWIFWRQDVRSAFFYWRQGELSLRDWASSWRGRKTDAVFSWRDPAPFLADVAQALVPGARPARAARASGPREPALASAAIGTTRRNHEDRNDEV
jgi:predicted ATP-grasp superfamily ATP-dependent carboligase